MYGASFRPLMGPKHRSKVSELFPAGRCAGCSIDESLAGRFRWGGTSCVFKCLGLVTGAGRGKVNRGLNGLGDTWAARFGLRRAGSGFSPNADSTTARASAPL